MAVINEVRRSVPPFPDPNDNDQARVNRIIIDLVRYLITQMGTSEKEKRLSELESLVKKLNDIIFG